MARILNGAEVAAVLSERCSAEADRLKAQGVSPKLAILRVGARDDDVSYERGAMKRCTAAGVDAVSVALPADAEQGAVLGAIEELNADASVHGILMLRPLPRHLDEVACCAALDPAKDVDAATTVSLAGVFTGAGGSGGSGEGFAPCTAQACMEILAHYGIDVAGKRAVVMGRSLVIGRPVAMLLMAANATVTICHTKTVDVPAIARDADIVVVAVGRSESIGSEHFRAGQTVVDVGVGWNAEKGKLCGDVRFDEVEPVVGAITPVPGGVGSVTTSVLASHVVEAARRQTRR